MLFDRRFLTGLTLAIGGLLAAGAISCSRTNESSEAPPPSEEPSQIRSSADTDLPLRFSVKSLVTPEESFSHYYDLFRYLESKVGRTIQFTYRRSYAEVSALLKSGDIDAAFVCGTTYTDGHDEFDLELLVVPQVYGKTVYHSVILVPVGSPAKRLEDLRGKRFAFADPNSNSGKLVISHALSMLGEAPETFFAKYIYTYAHGKSVQAVAARAVDGAAVDSLIWDYMRLKHPEVGRKVAEIWRSPPHGIPPVVVNPKLDTETKEKLRSILLSAHKDDAAKPILEGLMVDKFVIGDDSDYESVRKIARRFAGHRKAQASRE
jgi:phosphonate transport system substrate-binding protein